VPILEQEEQRVVHRPRRASTAPLEREEEFSENTVQILFLKKRVHQERFFFQSSTEERPRG
jgi:hypothetical protein